MKYFLHLPGRIIIQLDPANFEGFNWFNFVKGDPVYTDDICEVTNGALYTGATYLFSHTENGNIYLTLKCL